MNNEHYQKLIADYLAGNLDSDQQKELELLISSGDIDFIDFKTMEQLHEQLDITHVPEPSSDMSSNFYAMLEAESEKQKLQERSVIKDWFLSLIDNITLPRLAYAFSLMVIAAEVCLIKTCKKPNSGNSSSSFSIRLVIK